MLRLWKDIFETFPKQPFFVCVCPLIGLETTYSEIGLENTYSEIHRVGRVILRIV